MPSESNSPPGRCLGQEEEMPGGRTESELCLISGDEHLAFWTDAEQVPEPPTSFVYVVRADGDDPIKVGRAVDVRKRIAGLQTGNPRPLRLLHVLPGGAQLEWQLHYRLRNCRLVGEWFGGEEIPAFLEFVNGLAEYLIAGQRESGTLLNFRCFRDGWAIRRAGETPTTVRFRDADSGARSSHPAFAPYRA
jgi:Meiotically Up-regulated Gene 113 (MUG113) protein